MTTRLGSFWPWLWLSVIAIQAWTAPASAAANCAPFFDDINNPTLVNVFDESTHRFVRAYGDMSPRAPEVTKLDADFLTVCGAWGSKVSPEKIRALLDAHAGELMNPLKSLLPASQAAARDALVAIWTARGAFEHIFCGQPSQSKIGGLHFGARYLQLQKQGAICRKTGNSADELLEGRVYTMGITTPAVSDPKKGYALGEHARDIFYEATWTFLRHCAKGSRSNFGCLVRSAAEPTVFNQLFCAQGRGLITRYSVASGEIMSGRRCDDVPRL